MPGSHSHSALEQLIFDIGQKLGRAMVEGLRPTLSNSKAGAAVGVAPIKRGPGRPPRSASEAKCLVSGCHRRSVAKKLCPTHYRKAGRLQMTGALSASDLAILKEDGRATRWAKKKAKSKPTKRAGKKKAA